MTIHNVFVKLWCSNTDQALLLSSRDSSTHPVSMSRPLRGNNAFRSHAQYNYLQSSWPCSRIDFKVTRVKILLPNENVIATCSLRDKH